MKRWLGYIQYFFFLGFNWNFPLAIFIVRREISGERKYNHFVSGTDDLKDSVGEADRQHASIYQPINFYTAEKLFEQIPSSYKKTAILDAGSGKGRVLAMAAYAGFTAIYGFDISADMCLQATQSLQDIQKQFPKTHFDITVANANEYDVPDDVGVIFLFNPFDGLVMQDFIAQVMLSLRRKSRNLLVLYANPVHKSNWTKEGFTEVYAFQKMKWLEGVVLLYQQK